MNNDETTQISNDVRIRREKKPRETWTRKLEFMLTCIGFAVGIGNVWRFPYLCYTNGGGAFLIPYLLMLTFLGLPLFYLELAMGQYGAVGSIAVWKIAPVFKGIGYAMNVINIITGIYYNVVISYAFLYFFASFTSVLPWSGCDNWWNDERCLKRVKPQRFSWAVVFCVGNITNSSTMTNTSTSPAPTTWLNTTSPHTDNATGGILNNTETPSIQYWRYYVLGRSPDMAQMGGVQWHLALCLLLAWVVVFLCIIKGIKSSGKVSYFTATFPYVVLICLFFRGVTLEGAGTGILYYIRPNFHRMAHAQVWKDAAVQILYSLGAGFGGLITMGSFNKFSNNCQKDAIIVSIVNCGTSVFAGFVIFAVLGFMAHETGLNIDQVADEGPGLAFVAYPEALVRMPGAPFWSLMFFFMLILLGINSQFVSVQCLVAALRDDLPILNIRRTTFTLVVCVVMFLLGLPCVTQGGIYLVQLLDKYSTSFPLFVITIFETTVIGWVYGVQRVRDNISSMIGWKPNYYWTACWAGLTPLLIMVLLLFSIIDYKRPAFEGQSYPDWADSLGWLSASASIIMIPLWAIIRTARHIGSFKNLCWVVRGPGAFQTLKLMELIKPNPNWGPAISDEISPDGATAEDPTSHDPSSSATGTGSKNLQDINVFNPLQGLPSESYI